MMKELTMEALIKEQSVRVYPGMICNFHGTLEAIDMSEVITKFPGAKVYCTNNSTCAFILDNEFYVTPATRRVYRLLKNEGFDEKFFYVPFSNGDYPKDEEKKWIILKENMIAERRKDFYNDCAAYCDKRSIGFLSDEILHNCFQIPESGVRVKHLYFEDTYYPVMNQSCLDCRVEHLGKYCCNNGKVVFVYRNGRTYVTKGYKIIRELESAGYKKAGLFVPFSNGEELVDAGPNCAWAAIRKF